MRRNEDLGAASSNESLNGQVPSETEATITKWSVWINRAKFGGYLLSTLGWILCIFPTVSDNWRLWHVKSKDDLYPGLLWIGIWRACYLHSTHPEYSYIHCDEFTENLKTLPKEIFLAQDLLILGCITGAVGITFMSFALWNVVKTIRHTTFSLTLFNYGGFINFLTGIIILIPISWNSYSVMINADIMFPDSFKMPTSPVKQEIGVAIYIGYLAAILLVVSGVMIICDKRFFQNLLENDTLSPEVESLVSVEIFRNTDFSRTINQKQKEEPEAWTDAVTSANTDIKKESVQSMYQKMFEDAKKVPIILVKPYVAKSQVKINLTYP